MRTNHGSIENPPRGVHAILAQACDACLRGGSDRAAVQFLRYCWVGGAASCIDVGAFAVLTKIVGVHYLVSNIGGFLGGVLTNYALSVIWVFRKRRIASRSAEFMVFVIIGVIGLALNEWILYLLHEGMRVEVVASKVGATGIVLVWNFLARKFALFT